MRPALSGLERDLVVAALAQDGREVAAFERFTNAVDFTGPVDGGHFRMLPLTFANLKRAGVDPGRLVLLRGVYKYSWCKAHEHVKRAAEAVSALADVATPVIVSKGVVLAQRYYDSPAHRPMSDVDLVIPVERVRDAIGALKRRGYQPVVDPSAFGERHYADYLVSRSSETLRRGDGEIDLHWYVMRQCRTAAANARFWRNSQPFEVSAGAKARQLRPGDMLMHVVVHGLQWNPMSPLRWIADAAMVLRRAGGEIDWDEAFEAAAELRIEGHVRAGLEFLRELEVVELPLWRRAPRISLAERAERWAHGRSFEVNLAVDVIRMARSDARRRIPQLAAKWAARRIGLL